MALTTFAPFLANTTGWLITELGRYPWTVYGLFTIMDSVSPNVSTTSLLISNTIYFLLFTGLAAVMVTLVVKEVRKGPELEEVAVESPVDPFEGGAVHE
jgi:cytochrome d ubiquinol oxidase subunit I